MADSIGNNAMPTFTDEQLEFVDRLVANSLISRASLFDQIGNIDKRRNLDDECGYPPSDRLVTVHTYRQLYEREPIPERVVQVWAKECWQVQPCVYEDADENVETDFEKALAQMARGLGGQRSWFEQQEGSPLWNHFLVADILSGIGHFGVMLLGFDDGKTLDQPVEFVDVASSVPDSYLSEEEESLITDNTKRVKQVWDIDKRELVDVIPPPLTVNENKVVSQWKQHRDMVVNRQTGDNTVNNVAARIPYYGDYPGAVPYALPPDGTSVPFTSFGPGTAVIDDPNSDTAGTGSPDEVKTKRKLLFIRSFDESMVEVVRQEWDINNPRFGQPVMYRITLNDPRQMPSVINGMPATTVFVHWTRVIHIADNTESNSILGKPRMRPVLNRLLDLRKTYGGSAEMYYKGAFPGLSIESHPSLGGDVKFDRQKMKDRVEEYFNGLQRGIITSGFHVNSLAPQVVDPSKQIEVQIESICIELEIPKRVFMGSERGEQASTQDDASWNDKIRMRENGYITPKMIVPFFDRMILVGVLPAPKKSYCAKWPDLDSQTDDGRAGIAMKKTQAIAQYVKGQGNKLIGPKDYLIKILNFTAEEADAIIAEADGFDQPIADIDPVTGNPIPPTTPGQPNRMRSDGLEQVGTPEVSQTTGQKKTNRSADKTPEKKAGGDKTLLA